MKYIIANWKENKNLDQVIAWLKKFIELSSAFKNQENKNLKVIICPSITFIIPIFQELQKLGSQQSVVSSQYKIDKKDTDYQKPKFEKQFLYLGAQNVSQYEGGRYTGETSILMIKDYIDYVIIGHSERRKYFGETNEAVNKKIELCLKHEVTPIVCVANLEQVESVVSSQQSAFDPSSGRGVVSSKILKTKHRLPTTDYRLPIIVFEPIEAISDESGSHPDNPEHAQKMAKEIKKILGDVIVIYGGSVNSKNVGDFVRQKDIGGVLVGESSLDVEEFFRIIKQVYSVDAKT